MEQEKQTEKKQKKRRGALSRVLGVAAILCLGVAVLHYFQEKNAGKSYETLQEEVKEETPVDSEAEDAVETIEAEEEPLQIPIDFASLQERNPDIYAWITIPGTAIDYPVVQHPDDNSYYLTHDVDGNEDAAGAIFSENYNSTDFTDPNTVLYGHNMKNGTMFRGLHDYQDRTFFDENREVTIYMPDEILHYEIFAAYLYDSRHLLQSFDFTDKEVFADYLDTVRAQRGMNAFVDTDVEVTEEDQILTLSTCYKGMDDRRYLVQAVLVSIEK